MYYIIGTMFNNYDALNDTKLSKYCMMGWCMRSLKGRTQTMKICIILSTVFEGQKKLCLGGGRGKVVLWRFAQNIICYCTSDIIQTTGGPMRRGYVPSIWIWRSSFWAVLKQFHECSCCWPRYQISWNAYVINIVTAYTNNNSKVYIISIILCVILKKKSEKMQTKILLKEQTAIVLKKRV